jgi:hypothetical protein
MNHRKPLSRFFPAHHPRKGQRTFFAEKIVRSKAIECPAHIDLETFKAAFGVPKYHTIRQVADKQKHPRAKDVKVGDTIQFYVWSGKPYASPQIVVTPKIPVLKVWDFKVDRNLSIFINDQLWAYSSSTELWDRLSENDGVSQKDLQAWFKCPKPTGPMQIICWSNEVEY